jgi:hypothetical protein
MSAPFVLLRFASLAGEEGKGIGGSSRNKKEGWQDKSSAVGRAAGGWFGERICDVWSVALPSFRPISRIISACHAPSLALSVHG